MGRWQTRIFLLGTVGLLITALIAYLDRPPGETFAEVYFYVLGYVVLFGLGWDILYHIIQQLKWDRDWPPYAQWAAGAWEGFVVYMLIRNFGLPEIAEGSVPLGRFLIHYSSVFFAAWAFSQGPMRALFPLWRFHGGRIV
jgi:hypothetical protein